MNYKVFLLSFFCVFSINTVAQRVSVKSVSLRQADLRASTNPRLDNKGQACAIVRVGIVGVKDLQFPDAIGSVDYSLGEYIVYVPKDLQKFNYHNTDGKISGTVVFDDYGLEIETKRVYSVVFESENHMRAAIFAVHPVNATLTFNGQSVSLDKEGVAIIERPVGEYSFKVDAPGYVSQTGKVRLTDDEITSTTNVILEQNQYALNIRCQPTNASLFIDNNPYGTLDGVTDLKLPDGEHIIRLTAVGYNDYEKTITINGQASVLNVNMSQMEEKVVKHKEERTRTHVNIRPGYYTTVGGELYDKNQYLGHDWGLKFSFGAMQHFASLLSLYEGIGGGIMNLKESEKTTWFEHPADSANTWFLEVPLLIGVSVPFGKYNKHLFSVLGGAYGKAMFTEIVDSKSTKTADAHGNSNKTNWDYGLRGMAILDISHFTISAEVSLSLAKYDKIVNTTSATSSSSKEKNKPNLFFGITVGAKFGKL